MALKTVDLDPRDDHAEPLVDPASAPGPARFAAIRNLIGRARPHRGRILLGALAIAILTFGAHWLLIGRFEIKTDNAFIRADITHVATKVRGYVKEVHVQDNQHVKAGDILVTLHGEDFEASLAEARAALAQAEAAPFSPPQRSPRVRPPSKPRAATPPPPATFSLNRAPPRRRRMQTPNSQARTHAATPNLPRRAGTRSQRSKPPTPPRPPARPHPLRPAPP